jgi:hypothetical protein
MTISTFHSSLLIYFMSASPHVCRDTRERDLQIYRTGSQSIDYPCQIYVYILFITAEGCIYINIRVVSQREGGVCPIVLDITIPYCQCVHFSDPDRFRNTGAPLTAEKGHLKLCPNLVRYHLFLSQLWIYDLQLFSSL